MHPEIADAEERHWTDVETALRYARAWWSVATTAPVDLGAIASLYESGARAASARCIARYDRAQEPRHHPRPAPVSPAKSDFPASDHPLYRPLSLFTSDPGTIQPGVWAGAAARCRARRGELCALHSGHDNGKGAEMTKETFQRPEGTYTVSRRQDIRTNWYDLKLDGVQAAAFRTRGAMLDYVNAVYRSDEDDTLGSCGCTDYHMADCPLMTTSSYGGGGSYEDQDAVRDDDGFGGFG